MRRLLGLVPKPVPNPHHQTMVDTILLLTNCFIPVVRIFLPCTAFYLLLKIYIYNLQFLLKCKKFTEAFIDLEKETCFRECCLKRTHFRLMQKHVNLNFLKYFFKFKLCDICKL